MPVAELRSEPAAQPLSRQFAWLWAAYAVSTFGTWVAFDAFPLIAIIALHAGPAAVALLASTTRIVGAVLAVPLGPWMEFRRKRRIMIAMDLIRFLALMSLPVAFAFGWLGFIQLLLVAVVVGAADIAFKSASGACLKALVPPEDLLLANGRLESTTWTATAIGPPLGGAAFGMFGPVATVIVNAISFLLSALGICAIGGSEAWPVRTEVKRLQLRDLLDGWTYILRHPTLRPLFFNSMLVNGLIMATAPILAVLMLGQLGFAPWQYGLAFGAPCIGGLIGARLTPRLVARFGQSKVMFYSGVLRACWSIGLTFIGQGMGGIALVIAAQFGLLSCMGIFNPVFATYRLQQTEPDRVTRTLTAWAISSSVAIALLTALWGLLASVTSPRMAIAVAGVLLLITPLLLVRAHQDCKV